MTKQQPEPEIEAGAVETEQHEDPRPVPSLAVVEPDPMPAALQTQADLTGAETSEIRARGEIVDKAQRAAQEAQAEATHLAQMHQFAQEALTARISGLIQSRSLDPNFQYRVDLGRGVIVAVAPITRPAILQ